MTMYLGVDYAKKFSVATLIKETGEMVKRCKLVNQRVCFEAFLKGCEHVRAVAEAGWNWRVIVDLLEGLVEEIQLAHPLKVRAIAEAKIKTDAIDSETLAQLLRAGLIPQAYLRNKESGNKQKILRTRSFYIRMRTKVRNRIHHCIDGQRESIRIQHGRFSDLFGKKGEAWLRKLDLSDPDKQILENLLNCQQFLCQRIRESDLLIEELFRKDENSQLLATIPGFGPFLSVLTCVEIDNIDRFPSASKLASYAGLVPSTYSSGARTWHGKIHKQGNKWLRWALVEAAIHASGLPSTLRTFYSRLKRRKGIKTARVATARKLCSVVFRILKQKSPFYFEMKVRSRLQPAHSVT